MQFCAVIVSDYSHYFLVIYPTTVRLRSSYSVPCAQCDQSGWPCQRATRRIYGLSHCY